LVKENKKFLYGMIKEGARAKEFEVAIEWLKDAGLVYKVNRVKKPELPLSAYQDFAAFKMFVLDIGLFGAMHQLDASLLMQGNTLFSEYKGALTEQYVMQQLVSMQGLNVYYWSAENSRGELDFLVQHRSVIHPIEVKAEENLKSKSLRAFVERYPMLHGIRFSMSPYREQDWMTNYPLYLISNPFTS
jgi:predicted AAA+ superfamily ATPase